MKLVLVAAAAAAAAGFLLWQHRAEARVEARLADVASEIARREVRVRCQGRVGGALDVGPEKGTVVFDQQGRPADVTDLDHDVCARLRALPGSVRGATHACLDGDPWACSEDVFRDVEAVHTLSHEAWHLAGYEAEQVAECYALQTTALVAVRLGAPPQRARAMARLAWGHLYPNLPSRYRDAECRDGGALDLVAHDAAWPS